jgi:hypothetical protein
VQRIRGFPQLVGDTYLSCANTALLYQGKLIIAAILVDAQHPGERPAPLPDASEISRQPQLFTVPIGTETLTARRVADTWLVIETSAAVPTRVAVLRALGACIRLSGRCG